jgi:hypothetical protein
MIKIRYIRPESWANGDKVKSDEDATMLLARYTDSIGQMNDYINRFNTDSYLHINRKKVELIMWNPDKVDDKGNKLVEVKQ